MANHQELVQRCKIYLASCSNMVRPQFTEAKSKERNQKKKTIEQMLFRFLSRTSQEFDSKSRSDVGSFGNGTVNLEGGKLGIRDGQERETRTRDATEQYTKRTIVFGGR